MTQRGSREASTRLRAGRARPVQLICLGLSALDMVWSIDSLPLAGHKIRARSFHETGGGMAANAAVAVARLGGAVQFWGRAGNDPSGLAMRDALAAEGVDVAQFRCFEGASSSVSCALVDALGERTIVNFRGADLPTAADWLPLGGVAAADAVLADPRWLEGAMALFGAARRGNKPTILDGDVADAQVFDALLPLTDFAVFSASGLDGYVPVDVDIHAGPMSPDLAEHPLARRVGPRLAYARSRGCRVAAVTLGEDGVVWLDDDGLHHLPAHRVQTVDTTGAGDVFHGGFAYAIACRLEARDAFAFAAAVAALKCRSAGGRAGAPDLETTLDFLQRTEAV
ncbi:MAG: PfkB family carbohydrate kinase [Burkholderiaceae bacterium]